MGWYSGEYGVTKTIKHDHLYYFAKEINFLNRLQARNYFSIYKLIE